MDLIKVKINDIETISFDHDLGGTDTAMPVVVWLEEQYYSGSIKHHIDWFIHSANPVGQRNLYAALSQCDYYWLKNK